MEYILDSYAWIEYWNASKKGKQVDRLFTNPENKFVTLACCLAEIQGWALRVKEPFARLLTVIKANSDIMDLSHNNWIAAGVERYEQRKLQPTFGLIDSAILVKQKELKCKVVTGDDHFKGFKDVVFLG